MQIRKKYRGEAEVFTEALNDILFILLMFFLIVSTLANPNVIRLSQPKSAGDTKAKQNVVVSIDSLTQYYVGTTPVALDSLKAVLIPIISKEKTEVPTIVINADKSVDIDAVVSVMRIAKELGARSVLSVQK
ncbi:MAG: biopolymer transporter ExbD [Chitinophagaceae bacterium]|nr:MAG: biopolymer transporter ExbD [Chitinophagaceae bacterium]